MIDGETMLKAEPASSYPPEEGRYLRGNDYSPVAVAVILIYDQEKIPPDIESLAPGSPVMPSSGTHPIPRLHPVRPRCLPWRPALGPDHLAGYPTSGRAKRLEMAKTPSKAG